MAALPLRRRHNLKRLRNLLLPAQAVLSKDLSTRLELLDTLCQQSSAQDNAVWTKRLLLMVNVASAILAIEAVDALSCIDCK